MKSVPFTEGETYPDLGSNFQAFTNSEFLELETLGPLKRLSAGETIVHKESWVVFSNVHVPDVQDEEKLLHAMELQKPITMRPIQGSSLFEIVSCEGRAQVKRIDEPS